MMAGSSLAGGIAQGEAAQAAGDFSARQSEANARLQEMQATDVEKRGKKEAQLHRRKVRGLIGSQRAALAAQGLDVNTGTAQDVQLETAQFGEEDAATIRKNAIREAYGLRVGAVNTRSQGKFDQIAGRASKRTSYLTGGMQAAGYGAQAYGEYKK